MTDREGLTPKGIVGGRLKDASRTIGNTPFKPTRETVIAEQKAIMQIKAAEEELERRLSPKAPSEIALNTPAEQEALDKLRAQKNQEILKKRDEVIRKAGLSNFNRPKLDTGK